MNDNNTNGPKIKIEGKPKYINIGNGQSFFELFRKIEKSFSNCFLFESLGDESNISRYHIIGFDPKYLVYSEDKSELILENTKSAEKHKYNCENPYLKLRDIIPQNVISRKYAGGLVGFISYDSINYFENSLNIKKNKNFECFKFGIFLDGLIYDQMTGEIFYYFYEESRITEIQKILNKKFSFNKNVKTKFLRDSMTKEEHRKTVLKIKDDIKNGLIFQCEVQDVQMLINGATF